MWAFCDCQCAVHLSVYFVIFAVNFKTSLCMYEVTYCSHIVCVLVYLKWSGYMKLIFAFLVCFTFAVMYIFSVILRMFRLLDVFCQHVCRIVECFIDISMIRFCQKSSREILLPKEPCLQAASYGWRQYWCFLCSICIEHAVYGEKKNKCQVHEFLRSRKEQSEYNMLLHDLKL